LIVRETRLGGFLEGRRLWPDGVNERTTLQAGKVSLSSSLGIAFAHHEAAARAAQGFVRVVLTKSAVRIGLG